MYPALESFRLVRLLNDTAHYEAHQNFIVSLRAQPCANVHSVLPEERCMFVLETEECRESMHYLDYMRFMYCFVDSSNVALFTVAIIGLLLAVAMVMMFILHLTVDRYVNSILYVAKSLHLNEYIAGVTLLTYGNGFPQVLSHLKHHHTADTELIYNQYMAQRGYPRLAFAGSLGGPIFNVLIGLGVVFIVQMVRTGSMTILVRDGMSGPTCAVYLFVIVAGMLLSLLFTRFLARANLALYLLASYAVFLLYIILSEFEVLHGYGTDHNDDGEYFHDQIPDG
ncbi:mitochondrial sodium/calcium exchanger protein-like [Anopheles darlingi]|uniref:mitochondrial sodium/calcium exchanger protein-like n=1 Tax=Anopheles darlingi TaxID=43151 RepID=UPI0021002CC6|nr:mitochondrial sodium/calcium exchanger protein-like [Anopheles darlingi]